MIALKCWDRVCRRSIFIPLMIFRELTKVRFDLDYHRLINFTLNDSSVGLIIKYYNCNNTCFICNVSYIYLMTKIITRA